MEELIKPLIGMVVIVWSASELIGRVTRLGKDVAALILGVVCGPMAFALGYLPLPEVWHSWVWAGTLGLLATAGAGVFHDKAAKVVSKRLKKAA